MCEDNDRLIRVVDLLCGAIERERQQQATTTAERDRAEKAGRRIQALESRVKHDEDTLRSLQDAIRGRDQQLALAAAEHRDTRALLAAHLGPDGASVSETLTSDLRASQAQVDRLIQANAGLTAKVESLSLEISLMRKGK